MKMLNTFLALAATAAAGASIQVNVHEGVPQIQVDGVSVRPRWFWGGPTAPSRTIKPGEQRISLDLKPLETTTGKQTFHFRFGRHPGTYWLGDFVVEDITDGTVFFPRQDFSPASFKNWTFFPQDERNVVGTVTREDGSGPDGAAAMRIDIVNPPKDKSWPDFHIYTVHKELTMKPGHTYRCSFWLKATAATTLHFSSYRPASPSFIRNMGDMQYEQQLALARDAGVDFISPAFPMPWPKPGEPENWEDVDRAMNTIIAVNPKAKIIPRLGLEPPYWWKQDHPDELMGWQNPAYPHWQESSVSSLLWRKEATERLRKLIRYLEEHYPDNMGGYHPCGQNTSEWFYKDSWQQDYHGYSPCEIAAFRTWLKRKYGTDAALQTAWQQPAVTFATAQPPSPDERTQAPVQGILLDPLKATRVIDHNLFLQDEMTDTVLMFARVIRECAGRNRLTVFFYGYCYEFSTMNRISACGHLGMRKLLDSPDVDIICSPISYFDREIGGGGHAMTSAESVLAAGKLWLYEDDARTHLATSGNLGGLNWHAPTQWDARQIMLRNTGQEIIRNLACWWMDLVRAGWYNDPALWQDMKDLGPMDNAKLAAPCPYNPPVAAIYDEFSSIYTKNARPVTSTLLYFSRREFSHLGVPYGQYYLDDLLNGKVPARVAVLLNPWVLTDDQCQKLKAALNGKFAVWCHAPAAIDPVRGYALDRAKALTGFSLTPLKSTGDSLAVTATDLGRANGLPTTWTVKAPATALNAIIPADDTQVLATWPDGSAAVAIRADAICCASPVIPRELLRLAAVRAGLHVYTDDANVFYSDDVNCLVHATKDGPATFRFPVPHTVKDVLTGKTLTTQPVRELQLQLRRGETRIFRLD